ncbi:MAG TPA: ABC transporter ATP-binding protein [Acidimicrobiales bacterium]|nr:ABC transporter ATP-binding protein [Acidimicrobiales bacterium]
MSAPRGTDGRAFLDGLDARRTAAARTVMLALGTGPEAATDAEQPARDAGLGLLVRLALLAAVSALPMVLFVALLPEMSDATGASRAALTGLTLASGAAAVVGAIALAAAAHRRGRVVRIALGVAVAGAMATGAAALAATGGGLALGLAVASVAAAATRVLHPALLVDGYLPAVRTRVLFAHRAADTGGRVAAFALAAGLTALALTWRAAFLISGAVALVAVVVTVLSRPRQPFPGATDTERVRELVSTNGAGPAPAPESPRPLAEEVRRALHRPTVRRVLAVWAALGAVTIPLVSFAGFFLADRWHVAARGRLGVLAVATAAALPALALVARRVEVAFAEDPGAPLRTVAAAALVAAGGLIVAVAASVFFVALVGLAVALAAVSIAVPLLDLAALSVVVSPARPAVAALAQLSYLLVGGIGGVLIFGGIDRRFGLVGGLVSLLAPALLLAVLARRAAPVVAADLERLGDDVVVAEELARYAGSGKTLPLLVCRGLDFSYGQLQVLFGVDFTVDEGQLVALLGTNGAGKSTLLRVISGLGFPSHGSVHLRGEDITFLDAEERLRLGIAQVPGGRAVFGPLTVLENLEVVARAGARRGAAAALDDVFAAFPRLAERRDQPAATLSGGEQQMLGLSKALLLRPRVLLVDELSLGLAPKVVSELLEMVRRINREGTAVVLVEQSVNVALSIADHAFFMEKGEVRFDGPAAKLLDRNDLVRSVFLGGAAKRLSAAGRRR